MLGKAINDRGMGGQGWWLLWPGRASWKSWVYGDEWEQRVQRHRGREERVTCGRHTLIATLSTSVPLAQNKGSQGS